MYHLRAPLTEAHEKRCAAANQNAWHAMRAIIDDFIAKSAPDGEGLTLAEGAEPRYRFDPYESVARLSTGTPADAWEPETAWVTSRLQRLSGLAVAWDRGQKVFFLSLPRACTVTVGIRASCDSAGLGFGRGSRKAARRCGDPRPGCLSPRTSPRRCPTVPPQKPAPMAD
jgi:hypothetical protein